MKTIHLIRHAKSSWEDISLADKDRPLNKRGIKSCKVMAKEIVKQGCTFKNVFCSSALRAQLTIQILIKNLGNNTIEYKTDQTLYTFNRHNILSWCKRLDNELSEVVIVGHNPALTEFCNDVSNKNILNLATCSYAQLKVNINIWEDISNNTAELTSLVTPKMLKKR